MENKNIKIWIISLIIIGAVAGASFYLLSNMESQKINTNNTNNLSTSANNTTLQNNSSQTKKTNATTESSVISAKKAISIVKNSAPSYNCRFSAKLIKSGVTPYYMVTVYDDNSNSSTYGEAIGGAKVNAKTGAIIEAMG